MSTKDEKGKGGIAEFHVGFGSTAVSGLEAHGESTGAVFRIVVLAELGARDEFSLATRSVEPVRFERATFDEAMAQLAPALAIDVPDPRAPRGKPLRVELRFDSMRAFRPDALVQSVPWLQSLQRESGQAAPPHPPEGGSLLDDILDATSKAPSSSHPATGGLDAALASILTHPEIRRLERTWRGLKLLVDRCEPSSGILVEAASASADEVDAALQQLAAREVEGGIDLLVVDQTLGSTRRDLDRLEGWAIRAEALCAPLVACALPELLGFDELSALGRTQRRLRSAEDPRAIALRNVAKREPMRFVCLAMNGALARPRYEGPVARVEGARLDEPSDLFVSPAYLVATLVAASFARTGWACAFTGPNHGVVGDLPVRVLADRGGEVATPLEALVTETAAREAAGAGVAVFASVENRDVAILAHAPTVYRPAEAAVLDLGEQLFVTRVARLVMHLAAAIPHGTEESAVRDVVRISLAEAFGSSTTSPEISVVLTGGGAAMEVTLRPRGFHGVRLGEITLGATLA